MIVFVDVDDVCADLMPTWLSRYNKDYDDNLTRESMTEWSLLKRVKPECGEKIYDYLEDPTLYDDVLPIGGAFSGVECLRQRGYRVVFATSATNGAAGSKLRWLIRYGFLQENPKRTYPDYVEGYDKGLLLGDVLIDDGPHNVQKFQGYSILMRRPHNQNFQWPVVAENWGDVIGLMSQKSIPQGVHITELSRPNQTRAFREVIENMYQVHLNKNADYSPANILGTGELGLMTRIWDKIARLMNLMGFKITISDAVFDQPSQPKCESIDDSIQDMSVYGIIWQLLRKGAWGK
jgi:5'(3')-deoxyribonucleotidase